MRPVPSVQHVIEERVIAERVEPDGGWLVMYPDGTVREYVDLTSAQRAIERHARGVQKRSGADAVLTTVLWSGTGAPATPAAKSH